MWDTIQMVSFYLIATPLEWCPTTPLEWCPTTPLEWCPTPPHLAMFSGSRGEELPLPAVELDELVVITKGVDAEGRLFHDADLDGPAHRQNAKLLEFFDLLERRGRGGGEG